MSPGPSCLGVSLLLLAIVALGGCSTSYNAERLSWKAQQLSVAISKDPSQATPEQFAKAIEAFERVTEEAAGTGQAARAHLAIGSMYALQQDYDRAQEAYALVLKNFSGYKTLSLTARLAIAKTYGAEGNVEEVLKVHEEIAFHHPFTPPGLQAPLSIAQTYTKLGETDRATTAYTSATRIYIRLAAAAPTPELETQAKGYLALAYQELGEWEKTIELLEELADVPSGVNRPFVLLSLGSIHQLKLEQPKKAKAAYELLLEEFPEHPFSETAKNRLEHLQISAVPLSWGYSSGAGLDGEVAQGAAVQSRIAVVTH